ncbi:hypothetical protein [Atopobium deltae]|uniref:hypothetical protein n=1 Tax=Atopobium deltae TaxID=1393034 RepID=UPI0012E35AA1|nr:hypothetical protein [Atopobium deltae]
MASGKNFAGVKIANTELLFVLLGILFRHDKGFCLVKHRAIGMIHFASNTRLIVRQKVRNFVARADELSLYGDTWDPS